ncbi:MAG: NUDIX hydrolase [Clostridia bacterium]|nr:NUDIX hydrolase [Clostridia bacterium]
MGLIYPETPIVGVGGVVLKGDAILLVKRGQAPSKGFWGVPGGCLELGEGLKEGVAREILEECGIEVEVGDLFDVFENLVYDEKRKVQFHYIILDYYARHVSGELRAGSDADDCKYIPIKEAWDYPVTPGVREILKRLQLKGNEC